MKLLMEPGPQTQRSWQYRISYVQVDLKFLLLKFMFDFKFNIYIYHNKYYIFSNSIFCIRSASLAIEAPANRLGTLARAVHADGATGIHSLAAASKVHPTHGERDAHRLFRRYWLSLRVPISDLQVPLDDGQHISISHYKVL